VTTFNSTTARIQAARRSAERRRVVGYVRVSTDEQSTEGVSLAAQQERLRAYGIATGRAVDEVIVDAGKSAKNLVRPGMQRIAAGLRSREIGTVIVLKLDRLTRSVRDLAELLDAFAAADAALVSVSESLDTSTASGRLMLNLLASVSQWEREAIGERTAFALAHKRNARQAYGTTPYGFGRNGDRLVCKASEQRVLRKMRDLRERGLSFNRIAAALNSDGHATRCGGEWYAASVHSVLTSRMAAAS